jgi:imidazoleglycerol-phosphate dehydratase
MRTASFQRKTNETDIQVIINLDGQGQADIVTGIGFLDHMLAQIAVHGLFDLTVSARGDLNVDPHHTVEDTALALGEAINQALTDRKGIQRMGSSIVPMDETLGEVILDFSGRPYCIFNGEWTGTRIGELPVTVIEHFFYSLSMRMKATLHLNLRYGRDDHHKAEALFKALGRALCTASRLDPRRADSVPSSKGSL